MSAPLKLLVVYNDTDRNQSQNIYITAFTPNNDPNNATLVQGVRRKLVIAPGSSSDLTPAAVWDSANGLVLVALRTNSKSQMAVLSIRPGYFIGQNDVLTLSASRGTPSIMYYQNQAHVAWLTTETASGPQRLQIGRPDSSTANAWSYKIPIGPADSQFKSSMSPRILRVGNDQVYLMYMDPTPTRLDFAVIDAIGYRNTWTLTPTPGGVYWNTYFIMPTLSGTMSGWSAVLVTGSDVGSRKIHVFFTNTNRQLRYFYFPLGANGLPATLSPSDPDNNRVDAVGERVFGSAAPNTPLNAVLYNGRIYLFYGNDDRKLCYYSRKAEDDAAPWLGGIMTDLPVSNDGSWGGVGSCAVQGDF
ncbi:hypothetical protein MMC34_001692 [Xylographa carneopallida]|nr:hypothetical protein [Xylographa carneopallida]